MSLSILIHLKPAFLKVWHKQQNGNIVTFGITPDTPETGYGYIQFGELTGSDEATYHIARFVEKPNRSTAQTYLDAGTYLWNSGLFMMRASVWLSAIGKCRKDILIACKTAWDHGSVDGDFLRVNKDAFEQCPADSIDYAVMERLIGSSNNELPAGIVIPLSAGWSDVGAWDSLWEVLPKDDAGNVSKGDVILNACKNVLAISESRLVACVGIENMVVVETPDAILVVHKDKTQDVKLIVDKLRQQGRSHKGICTAKCFALGVGTMESILERFQVKRIVVKPGRPIITNAPSPCRALGCCPWHSASNP